jgi:hypothetical protein
MRKGCRVNAPREDDDLAGTGQTRDDNRRMRLASVVAVQRPTGRRDQGHRLGSPMTRGHP